MKAKSVQSLGTLWKWAKALALALILFALVCALLLSFPLASHAQQGTGIIRVATTGTDTPSCGGETNPCETVQYAVELAAAGDEVRIAGGT